jgi:hypothetical protein
VNAFSPKTIAFLWREVSPSEPFRVMWDALLCGVVGHRWNDFEYWNPDACFLEEHWRECKRCERYENLMERVA